jgi:hypothetical protein
MKREREDRLKGKETLKASKQSTEARKGRSLDAGLSGGEDA